MFQPVPRPAVGLLAVALTAAGLAGCARAQSGSPTSAAVVTAPTPSSAAAAPAGQGHPGMVMPAAGPRAATPAGDDGAAACVRLQALLGQHTVLAADMMRARAHGDPDFAQAAEVALTRNTQAISTLLGSRLGADAAATFSTAWVAHVTGLFDYAEARRASDDAGQKRARKRLADVEQQLATFFSGASKGGLPRAAALAALRMHVDELLAQTDAYVAGDHASAAAEYRHSFEHAFVLGGTLAKALWPARDVARLATPAWQLRSNLTQLLGEHVALVVASMRAASGSDKAEFRAFGDALNANTKALATAVGTLFGGPAASRFQSLWADHVDALLALTAAGARGDTAAQKKPLQQLRAFEPALAALLDGATGSKIGAQALAHAYVQHDEMLTSEVQAYQAKDYTRAHDLGYQAYDEMAGLAGQLANAIGLTLGGKLPHGGSQTGGGGTAHATGGP